ncbi:hypothetical protein F4780DRAFT_695034 [Xylariomycetidae sp. FL0641]|nr:hypothetical protein F4780DRAFT_695034 [Xylariomycetidae sp. FL0641]
MPWPNSIARNTRERHPSIQTQAASDGVLLRPTDRAAKTHRVSEVAEKAQVQQLTLAWPHHEGPTSIVHMTSLREGRSLESCVETERHPVVQPRRLRRRVKNIRLLDTPPMAELRRTAGSIQQNHKTGWRARDQGKMRVGSNAEGCGEQANSPTKSSRQTKVDRWGLGHAKTQIAFYSESEFHPLHDFQLPSPTIYAPHRVHTAECSG